MLGAAHMAHDQEVMTSSCARGEVGYWEQFLLGMNTGRAAQGGGGVPIPGGIPELWGCGSEGRGQWAWWERAGVDPGDFGGLLQPS